MAIPRPTLAAVLLLLAATAGAQEFDARGSEAGTLAFAARALEPRQGFCPIGPEEPDAAFLPVVDAPVNFTLPDAAGRPLRLSSLRGKVVLLDFWATWCLPCRLAGHTLDRLNSQYAAQGLVVLGVNQAEPAERVAAFAAANGLGYRMLLDADGAVLASLPPFGPRRGVPSYVLIGRDGRIAWRKVGFLPGDEGAFEDAVRRALARGRPGAI